MTSRRAVLVGGASVAAAAVAGVVGWPLVPNRLRRMVGLGEEPWLPDATEGQVRLATVHSTARGTDVDLYTAVPAGYGDGAGLPTVVVLHGASATASDFVPYQLGRFVTAAVELGAEPFVLAGADGGVNWWQPQPDGDDPQRMVLEELPQWLAERGFDSSRRAVWGWSMGGYGALLLAVTAPRWARATAAFSPAVAPGDAVFSGVDALVGQRLGIWCGTGDPYYDDVRALVDAMPVPPAVTSFEPGEHTRFYWNLQTIEAFTFLASHLGERR